MLILSGSDGYDGGTDVVSGTLILTTDTALPGGKSLTVGPGGTLIFDPAWPMARPLGLVSGAAAAAVPEPGTLALLAAGLAVGLVFRRMGLACAKEVKFRQIDDPVLVQEVFRKLAVWFEVQGPCAAENPAGRVPSGCGGSLGSLLHLRSYHPPEIPPG